MRYRRALHDFDQAVTVAQRQVPGRKGVSDFAAANDPEASGRAAAARAVPLPRWRGSGPRQVLPPLGGGLQAGAVGRLAARPENTAPTGWWRRRFWAAAPDGRPPPPPGVLRGGGGCAIIGGCEGGLGRSGEHGGADGDRLSPRGWVGGPATAWEGGRAPGVSDVIGGGALGADLLHAGNGDSRHSPAWLAGLHAPYQMYQCRVE